MVKITNGVNIFEVTRGAFDGIYSHQGYEIMDENKSQETVKVQAKTDDEKFVDGIVKKPISQWSKEEVKKFASIKGVDISGTKNANEAKEIIKQFIEEDFNV